MGSGKTAVGRTLARTLGLPFHDSDAEIERRTGVDIPYIFDKEGEAGFREREREAIEALTALEGIVLATGGGAVLLPQNRRLLAARGRVVYLETSVAQQAHRVRFGRNRPLLARGRCGRPPGPADGRARPAVRRDRPHHRLDRQPPRAKRGRADHARACRNGRLSPGRGRSCGGLPYTQPPPDQ